MPPFLTSGGRGERRCHLMILLQCIIAFALVVLDYITDGLRGFIFFSFLSFEIVCVYLIILTNDLCMDSRA